MPIISEPELKLSISDSNRYKSHSEGSDRDLHEPVQKVLHGVQGQGLGNFAIKNQGVMNSWHILKKLLKEEEIVRYSNGWNPLLSKPEIKKIKEYHDKKRDATKEEAPSQATSSRREEEQEKELEKTILPKLQDCKNPKKMPWKMSST
ncbi:hypothetical protein O181_047439 [Austropuccinia psidii MF-1]|uniref:Uncharacterized protein n=1 Tax=Austropuccinia psidii MF-1 TaxID=1389203 RepID=A0A9Q3DQT7_9BASI|nr:hypothetical protein [Austropuccinia psidii MF-1]